MNPTSIEIRPLIESTFGLSAVRDMGKTVVFMPSERNLAVQAVELAIKHGFGICPSGAAGHLDTELIQDDVLVVSTANLDRMVEYAPDDLFIIVEAGMKLTDIAQHIKSPNLIFPFSSCGYSGTVGGAVASGIEIEINGDRQNIRQAVSAIEFVTPYGKLINSGALTIKSVAGYDIARFLAGSKGCFGIIISVAFRLKPNPEGTEPKVKFVRPAERISPHWDRMKPDDEMTPIDYLKQNLDPGKIFPMP